MALLASALLSVGLLTATSAMAGRGLFASTQSRFVGSEAGGWSGSDFTVGPPDASVLTPTPLGDPQTLTAFGSGSGNCASTVIDQTTSFTDLPTFSDVNKPEFGLIFTKLFKSTIKVDAICLEVSYTHDHTTQVTEQCFGTTASLTIIKTVVHNNGGLAAASEWTMDVTAINPTDTDFPGVESPGSTINIDEGAYSVDESGGPSGYTKTRGADCSGTLAVGESATCTITNDDDAPGLTLLKDVTNDDGGNASAGDFTLILNGGIYSNAEFKNGDTPAVVADTAYTLSETQLAGYTGGSVSCVDNSNQENLDHPVTLNEGQSVTCRISNDDKTARLTLIKVVVNDDGGTAEAGDWTLTAGGTVFTSGVEQDIDVGTYALALRIGRL